MDEDFDVDAMLENSYKKGEELDSKDCPAMSPTPPKPVRRSSSREKRKHKSHKHHGRRSHERRSHGRRSQDRKSHERRGNDHRRSRVVSPKREPKKTPSPEPTPEERDSRTVFCMQLGARVRERDIEDFFFEAGKIHDVRVITDSKTRRSKGIAYVEFCGMEGADNAVKMSGQRLCGRPVIIQYSQAEKNRAAASAAASSFSMINKGPVKLYMSSLHQNVTAEMLEVVFTKYGRVNDLKIAKDHYSGKSLGYGYVTFANGEDARRVIDQLNGYDLGGVRLRLSFVNESARHDLDQTDRGGVELGIAGKLQLMNRLAEGTGMSLPENASNVLKTSGEQIDTPCLILMGVFDYNKETQPNWADDIRDDIIEECDKFGGCVHMFVEVERGNVYVKCPTSATAVSVVKALHGRFYGGRSIAAHFIPLTSYHTLFPEAIALKSKMVPASDYPNNSYKVGGLYGKF